MRTGIAVLLVLGGMLAAPSCGYNYDALMGGSGGTGAGGQGASNPVAGSGGNANEAGTGGQPSPTGTAGLSGSAGTGVGAGGGIEPTGAAGNGSGGTAGSKTGSGGTGALTGTAGMGGMAGAGRGGASGAGAGGAAGKGTAGASGSSGHGGSAGAAGGRAGAGGGAAGSSGRGGSSNEVGLPTPYLRYTFDQTSGTKITDVTGHNHDATAVGTAVGFGNGIMGNDLSLNGTVGNYVSLPNGVVQSLTDVTIAFWVLTHSDTAADRWERVFDFGSNTNQNMYFAPHSSVDTARFAITTRGVSNEQQLDSPKSVPVNSWTHVAIVLSAGTGTIYINSIPTAANYALSLTPSSLGATSNNTLGRSQYSPDPPFNGEIDDFRIYSTALNPGQVSTLFLLR